MKTFAKETVIIPNSDFMTHKVINYTFIDSFPRIVCRVGVSYNTNIDLVKKVMLEIAAKHPEIVQDQSGKNPEVLFNEFTDSSIIFSLYCTLKDMTQSLQVTSELNSQIFKEFEKRNITIAFPQLDVHMKNSGKK